MPPLLLLLAALVPLARPDSRLQYYYGPADKSAETWAAWWRDFTQATNWSTALDTKTKFVLDVHVCPQVEGRGQGGSGPVQVRGGGGALGPHLLHTAPAHDPRQVSAK